MTLYEFILGLSTERLCVNPAVEPQQIVGSHQQRQLDHENSAVGRLDTRQHSAGRPIANRLQCDGWGGKQFA
jgi:hypothetical protein